MPKKNNQITVLAIGDSIDYDSFNKFHKEKRQLLLSGFDYVNVSYRQLLSGRIPQIKTGKVIIFLFFPFVYWNKYIEYKDYKGIYGNGIFFKKFMRFWNMVNRIIKTLLSEKEILFVNGPLLSGSYRDKLITIGRLSGAHIPQPKLYRISSIEDMQKRLVHGRSFFLKPRYGSMGKGITYLSWSNWQTNFIFKNNRIKSKRSDHGWKFRDVTGNNAFLRQLLKQDKDILIEQALEHIIIKKKKVDLRIYTFFNKVIYVYPRKNVIDKITTNISQGGRGDPKVLQMIPEHLLIKAKKMAEQISKILHLNFAGIDIILDRNLKDVYVIDVNVFSGFPKRKTFNLARHMIKNLAQFKKDFRSNGNIYLQR